MQNSFICLTWEMLKSHRHVHFSWQLYLCMMWFWEVHTTQSSGLMGAEMALVNLRKLCKVVL